MIVAINKPVGPTSHDMINRIRKIVGVKKVGHAGTLDPLASGVLVVAIGRNSTKKINEFVKKEKEYIAKIKLGEVSETDDAQGPILKNKEIKNLKIKDIDKVVKGFVGEIRQMPPKYSALKINGQSAYRLARAGKEVKLKPRPVEIKEIEILNYKWPELELRVVTGPGVYIRSLARDIGEKLDTGSYLAGLIRTRVGKFTLKKCVNMEDISEIWAKFNKNLSNQRNKNVREEGA